MANQDRVPHLIEASYEVNGAAFTARVVLQDNPPQRVNTGLLWQDGSPIIKSRRFRSIGFIDWDEVRPIDAPE